MQNRFRRSAAGLAVAVFLSSLLPAVPALALPDKVVEVSVVVDHELYLQKGADSEGFAQRVIAGMDTVYFAELGMHARLVNVTVMDVADPWSVTMVGSEADYVSLYSTFQAWQQNVLPGQRDVAVLLSGWDFQSTVIGYAGVGVMCMPSLSAAIVQAGVFSEAFVSKVVEHEVGHNVGMQHDAFANVCPPSGFIMESSTCPNCLPVSTQFSSCSDAYFASWLADSGATCLYEHCGSGVVDAGEDCDDGNVADGDCCGSNCGYEEPGAVCDGGPADACSAYPLCDGSGTCVYLPPPLCHDANPCTQDSCNPASGCEFSAAPATGCVTGAKASLQVSLKETDASKNKLKWKLSGGGLVDQAALGDPTSTRSWSLCVYDQVASNPVLKASLRVPAGGGWENKDPKGWAYEDKAGVQSGVTKIQLKTGVDGKSSASLSAAGLSFPAPMPVDASTFFAANPGVVVQLRTEDSGQCWSTEFPSAQINDGERYKAQVK